MNEPAIDAKPARTFRQTSAKSQTPVINTYLDRAQMDDADRKQKEESRERSNRNRGYPLDEEKRGIGDDLRAGVIEEPGSGVKTPLTGSARLFELEGLVARWLRGDDVPHPDLFAEELRVLKKEFYR